MSELTRPMAGFDSLMWGLERLPRMRSWIVTAVVLESAPDEAVLRERLTQLAAQVPRLRSTVLPAPRPLAARRWLEHDGFDADAILSRVSVRDVPGGLPALLARTADAPYEAGSPVWSAQIVDDLPEGRSGLVVRLHHSVTDGAGAMIMAALFFESDATGTRLMEQAPSVAQGAGTEAGGSPAGRTMIHRVDQVSASVREDVSLLASLARRAGGAVPSVAARALADPGSVVSGAGAYAASLARLMLPAAAPLSPVMTRHEARSAVGLLQYPVAELKDAARRYGGRLNDVYVAGVLTGLRAYHEASGVDPAEVPALRIYIPVNTRPSEDTSAGGNQFTPLRVELPLAIGSPAELVTAVRERLTAGRAEPALGAGAAVTELLGRMPTSVAGQLVSGMFYGLDACVTNVPGPPMPLWVGGRRVEALYALAPRSGSALCTCLLSYDGTAYVVVNSDAGAVTDPGLMNSCLAEGMRAVLAGTGG